MEPRSKPTVVGTFVVVLGFIGLVLTQVAPDTPEDWRFWSVLLLFSGLLLRIEGAIRDRHPQP